jgi:hypothetical protein
VSDLEVRTEDLRAAGANLLAVHREFSDASKIVEIGADAVAHSRLRERLRAFADNWDDNRQEMCESINGLGKAAQDAARVYEEIERELVRALRGEG